jgi:hypothetical protein
LKIKYFFKNFTLLNVLLVAVIILMAVYTLFPIMLKGFKYTLPVPKKGVVEKTVKVVGPNTPPPSDYVIIADANLFHPERRIPPEKKADDQQSLPTPEFVIYGTLITDTISLAYLEDLKAPRNTPGRGKRQIAMKIGDTLSGFTLKEINPDKVVMARGEDKITVLVHDPQRLKARDTATTKPQAPAGQPAPPGLPSRPASQTTPQSRGQKPPSVQDLVKPPAGPKTRAPNITKGDERALDALKRL